MKKYFMVVIILLLAVTTPGWSGERLNENLTVMGAEKAGNREGTIPAWSGGITQPPEYHVGEYRLDPFQEDRPLFEITAQNWEQYKDKLSAGYQALFAKYSDYRMPVYPSRRSASYPEYVNEAVAHNAGHARLSDDGNGVEDGAIAVPFPVPENGLEAIWNHLLRYRGQTLVRNVDEVVVASGTPHIFTGKEFLLFPNSLPGQTFDQSENIDTYFRQEVSAPPRLAGALLLVIEPLDKVRQLRRSWLYNAGLRRVTRAPFVNYDALPPSADGLRTYDQFDMFNGAIDRYDWTLDGKKEMYVPYNAYRFSSQKLDIKDVVREHFINPMLTRYELHRVWQVTATLKPGKKHLYAKRVFYLDEDSWQILGSEEYDARGNLWRFSEAHAVNFYDVPLVLASPEVLYDLPSGQYLIKQLQREPFDFSQSLGVEEFTPAFLRQQGNR